jgi:hypothetical protein
MFDKRKEQGLPPAANLEALPEQLVRVPRKLEIPPNLEERFEQLREKITQRVLSFGSPSKVSDALWCLLLEVNEGVVRPGFLGRQRPEFTERMDRLFGEGKWSMQHLIRGRLVPHQTALRFYEDAYVQYFKQNPDKLKWLTTNYGNVTDNSPTNVKSGFDYNHQEAPQQGNHIHDIAIRNAVRRLNEKFQGREILQVRGKYSKNQPVEGFQLSPGEISFHRPNLIPSEQFLGRAPWWKEGSIEHFYQATRRVVVSDMTADTAIPGDLEQSQSCGSYLHRIAARMTLRTLLVMLKPQATLTDVANLPWMMDYNSFPLGEDGLPRQFSKKELLDILRSSYEQLEGLLQRTGEQQHLLAPNGWTSFHDAAEFIEAIEAAYKGSLTEDQAERHHDIIDVAEWSKVLPHFQSFFAASNTRPLFLARDGLAVMEYMTYGMLIDGVTRADANEQLQKTMYLPGSPNQKTTKNQRANHTLFDSTIWQTNSLALLCKANLGLFGSPEDTDTSQKLHNLFEQKTSEMLQHWRDGRENSDLADISHEASQMSAALGTHLYQFWFDTYTSIKTLFSENLQGITIVDTYGTGKTALFLRCLLTFFAKERGDDASIDVLLGALISDPLSMNLGVPNLAERHGLPRALPDIRWPFKFSDFDSEPVFNVRQSPKNVLSLIYRSLCFYNVAVEAAQNSRDTKNS